MAVIISVVSDGSVVGAQQLGSAKSGILRITAVEGARYVLADTLGGGAAAGVSVKRVGKNLLISQDASDEQGTLIIEDFYGSNGQLVSQGADGQYHSYLALTDSGAVEAADLSDGTSSLLASTAAQPAAVANSFQFAEGGSSVFSSALAGVAAVAGGFALSNNGSSGGSKARPAPVASAFVLEDQSADAPAAQLAPAAVESGVAAVQEPRMAVAPLAEVRDEVGADAPAISGGAEGAAVNEIASNAGNTAAVETNPAPEAEAIGANGSVSAPVPIAPFGVDDIPAIDKMMDDKGTIRGVIADGGYTDDETPTIMGKAEPGVKVHVYRGKFLQGVAVADANGEWAYIPASGYNSGTHSFTVKYEYADKQTSGYSAPYVITIDKVPPAVPQIIGISDDEGRITGAVTDQTITDDNRPTIKGTAEAHATLIVYDKGKVIGSTTVDADGNWSFTPDTPLADGLHMLSYSATDRAGNSSDPTDVTEFFVDTRPEKINIYYADDDAGSVTGEVFSGGVTDDSTPTLFGTATAGGIVKIYEGSTLLGEVVADVDGTWKFTPPALSEGPHSLHATVTLPAKGESDPSKLFKLEVDLTAPSEPTIEQVLDDVGAAQGLLENGQTTDDATPTLSGKAEKGSTVRVFSNGNLLGSVLADANGVWVYTPAVPLIDGLHTFTISATDAAGNQTAGAAAHQIHVDTLRPDRPTIISVEDDVGQLQGLLQQGDVTDDTRPEMKGTAEAHSTVIVRDNGVEIGRVQANAQGEWSFTPEVALAGGAHGITVVSLDKAGNVSAPSDRFDFSVVVVPEVRAAAPTIVSIYDDVGLVKGFLNSGAVTDDSMPLISGKGEPYATVVLKDNGVEIGRSQVNAAGDWTFLPTAPLSFGLHNLIATTLDTVGNSSEPSVLFGFRVAEPGSGGALENFSSLTAGAWELGPSHFVLTSGLVMHGKFMVESIRHFTTGGMRPEDQHKLISVWSKSEVDFFLPVESQRISFYHYSSGGKATFLDAGGNVIGVMTLVSGAGYVKSYFDAPPGKFVASIKVDTNSGNASIAALKWGERNPFAVDIFGAEDDGFGSRVVYGKVQGIDTLDPKMALQVTTDGGKTWNNAMVREGSWLVMQKDMPLGDWVAEVRIIEVASGLSLGLRDTKAVGVLGAGAPVIERIADAEGMYTQAKAADGSLVEISLAGTGAKQGDIVHVLWGTVTYDHVLTMAEIYAAHATVKVPAEQAFMQGVTKDFSVAAQIISKDGAIGTLSKTYEVVGTYVVALATGDTLQRDTLNNAYQGVGFKITTDGVMVKTSSTASTHAGLTLSDAHQANGLFTLDKPAREVSFRLSGIDSDLGVKIQFFDAKGKLIEEQTVYGDGTAFHANAYRYATMDERVDIGSFRIIASESSVTLDGFTWRSVEHVADNRNPNVIDSSAESFYGTDGDDLVVLNMAMVDYMAGVYSGIHGGSGIDTLRLAGTSIGWPHRSDPKITSMEIIELAGGNATYINPVFSLGDVLRNGGTDVFYKGDQSRLQMMVKGKSTASIYLYDSLVGGTDVQLYADDGIGGDLGDWSAVKAVTINGMKYISYQHSTVAAELLVQEGIAVRVWNRNAFTEAPDRSSRLADLLDSKVDSDVPSLLKAAEPELFSAESLLTSHSGTISLGFGGAAFAPMSFSANALEVPCDLYLH